MTLEQFRMIKEQGHWGSCATLLLSAPKPAPYVIDQFGVYWIEAGHHIREQVADDRVLVRLLRHLLPPYKGNAKELFRGENRNRWESGTIGLAWTAKEETAQMFARGLNAVGSGGVLLRARFESAAILCGPNAHSNYLGEDQFTVDPFATTEFTAVEFFPAIN